MEFSEFGISQSGAYSNNTYQMPEPTLENDACMSFCTPNSQSQQPNTIYCNTSEQSRGSSAQNTKVVSTEDHYRVFDEDTFDNPYRQRMDYLLSSKFNSMAQRSKRHLLR